ncbi:hypothetical protein DV515_00008552, partial [Chloebia gouldiae]
LFNPYPNPGAVVPIRVTSGWRHTKDSVRRNSVALPEQPFPGAENVLRSHPKHCEENPAERFHLCLQIDEELETFQYEVTVIRKRPLSPLLVKNRKREESSSPPAFSFTLISQLPRPRGNSWKRVWQGRISQLSLAKMITHYFEFTFALLAHPNMQESVD